MSITMNLCNIFIDNATQADTPALAKLLINLFGIEQDFCADSEKQIKGLNALITSPHLGVIKVARTKDGDVIGMVSAQLVISTAEGAHSAWIEDMIVDASFRKQGVGKLLLEQALSWAKQNGATRAQLLVDLDNAPAIGYYDHLGWSKSRMGMRRILLK
jgi:GNAT superfamily N-acetyltransferase